MATFPLELLTALRRIAGKDGLPDMRSAGVAAATRAKDWPKEEMVQSPESAKRFIETQVSQGSDYCQVVMDPDTPSPNGGPPKFTSFKTETLGALVCHAHQKNKKIIAHAAFLKPFQDAITLGMDIITHATMDHPLPAADASLMKNKNIVAVPTLCMEKTILDRNPRLKTTGKTYATAAACVKTMHDANVQILIGIDSNNADHAPGHPMHGVSMHLEMDLIHAATGMKPIDILKAATSKPAQVFGLHDRGVIQVNKRADLVLLAGDPTENIQNTRMITQVWANGVPYLPIRSMGLMPTVSWGRTTQEAHTSSSPRPLLPSDRSLSPTITRPPNTPLPSINTRPSTDKELTGRVVGLENSIPLTGTLS